MTQRRPTELAAMDALRGMTQVDAARKHGVSQGAVSKAIRRLTEPGMHARAMSRSELAARDVVSGPMTASEAARKHGISRQAVHFALFSVRARMQAAATHQPSPVSPGLGMMSRAMARSLLALGNIADHAT